MTVLIIMWLEFIFITVSVSVHLKNLKENVLTKHYNYGISLYVYIEKYKKKKTYVFPYLFGTTNCDTIWVKSMKLKLKESVIFLEENGPIWEDWNFYPIAFMWITFQSSWLDSKSKEVTWYWREDRKFMYPGSDLAIS